MAIAEVGSPNTGTSTSGSLTVAITIDGSADTIVVGGHCFDENSDPAITRTMNGSAPDDGIEIVLNSGGERERVMLDVFLAPTTGNFVASGADSGDFQSMVAQQYSGVDQTTPEQTEATVNTTASENITINPTTSDGLAIAAFNQFFGSDTAVTPGASDTEVGHVFHDAGDGSGWRLAVVSSPGNGGSVTVSLDAAGTGDLNSCGFCLRAAVAGGANPKGPFGMPFSRPFAGPFG